MLDHADFSAMKYKLEAIPPSKLVVDCFQDLRAHREAFTQYKWDKRPEGIPSEYDVNDFLLRYIIYMDDMGSPAQSIPVLIERKTAVLKKLGVSEVSDTIKGIVFQDNETFNVIRVLFLRLQNNESWMILKHSEDELATLMTANVGLNGQKDRIAAIAGLQGIITTAKQNFFNRDMSRAAEETLMSLIVSENLNIRVEEWARIRAEGGELWPEIDILEWDAKKKCRYHDTYQKADSHFVVNDNDPSLYPIKIKLPECPDIRRIAGYGLAPKDQKWQYSELPEKLKQLDEVIRSKSMSKTNKKDRKDKITDEDRWSEIYGNPVYYAEEIKWIKREIKRRLYGYWFFNNGKPTYVPPSYYKTLNYWWVDNTSKNNVRGLPFFRKRDKEWFLFIEYCYTTTEAFYPYKVEYVSAKGRDEAFFSDEAEANEFVKDNGGEVIKGEFVTNMERRTCLGTNNPKHRRAMATFGAASLMDWVTTSHPHFNGAIQSTDETAAEKVFMDKFIKPWQKQPFFMRAIHDGNETPKEVVNYMFPSSKKGSRIDLEALGGWIRYGAGTVGRFDGDKVHFALVDEVGKSKNVDVVQRHNVIARALSTGGGSNIIGLEVMISTIGEKDSGGEQYWEIMRLSHWNERDKNGQTGSGLFNLFFPAYYCMEGFVDQYGESVSDTPPQPVLGIDGEWIKIGSKDYIANKIAELEKQKDFDGKNEYIRQHPCEWQDLYRRPSGACKFNVDNHQNRIVELRSLPKGKQVIETYSFDWAGEPFRSPIKATIDPKGRFHVSWLPEPEMRSKMFFDEEQNCYFPALDVQNKIFIGADPVRSKLSHLQDKGRGSSVGMAAFRKRDYVIDSNDEDSSNWESECFVMDYRYRPEDPKESLEDMLKACILYGGWMFGENNVKGIQDFFEEKGFAGYLLFNRDSKGKRKLEAGGATVGDFGEDLISWMMSYMSRHWKREKHIRIHEQCLEIYSRQDLTHADLFVGACYGGYAATYNSKMATRYVERETSSDSIAESFYPKFYYRV